MFVGLLALTNPSADGVRPSRLMRTADPVVAPAARAKWTVMACAALPAMAGPLLLYSHPTDAPVSFRRISTVARRVVATGSAVTVAMAVEWTVVVVVSVTVVGAVTVTAAAVAVVVATDRGTLRQAQADDTCLGGYVVGSQVG